MAENFEHKLRLLGAEHLDALAEIERLKRDLAAVHARPGAVWYWQGDDDQAESLTCPVVMHPETLREMVAIIEAARELDKVRDHGADDALSAAIAKYDARGGAR